MKINRQKRGSVLMEFIIVLPLYLALFGIAFFYGDLSLHAVKMAASGDRALAVSHGMSCDGRSWSKDAVMPYVEGALSLSSNNVKVVSRYTDNAAAIAESASLFSDRTHGVVADPAFSGSWSWLVGSTLYDDYALSPVSRSFVRAWKVFADVARMSDPNWEADREYADDSGLKQLFPSRASESYSLGRLNKMVSKDLDDGRGEVRAYAYYTLMRNGKGRTSYRNWLTADDIGGYLSNGGRVWEDHVYGEPYFFDKNDYEALVGENSGGDAASRDPRAPYRRYGQFETWSE